MALLIAGGVRYLFMATLQQKARLLKGLLTGETASASPFYVTVDVTTRCNLRCPGCLTHSPFANPAAPGNAAVTDLPYDMLEKLLRELATMGTKAITFSGDGEPFLHPRLFDLVSLAKKHGFHVTLFSNGTLLDETSIRSLADSGLDKLRISLWAGSREVYEKNYPGTAPETFDKIVDGLSRLSSARGMRTGRFPVIFLHHPINCNNFRSLESFVNLALRTACDGVSFSPLKARRGKLAESRLSAEEEKEARLSLIAIKKQLGSLGLHHNIDQTLYRYKIGEAVWHMSPCYIPWLHARFKVDGAVLVCNLARELQMGNLRKESFGAIWNGPEYRMFRRQALAKSGAAFINEHADCGFCCHTGDNMRVHHIYRWFLQLFRPAV